jgi:hypothetical protein
MDDSRDPDEDEERSTMAHVRPSWDTARSERNFTALMARLHGRRPQRRRLPALLTRLRLSRAAR